MKTTFRALLAATGLVAVSLVGSISGQTIIVQDSFTLNGTTRVSGASLNTRTLELGSGTWTANTNYNNAVFSSTGSIVSASTAEVRVAVPALTGTVTLAADMTVGTGSGIWTSIGFATSTASSAAWGWVGAESPLRVRLQGQYWFLERGSNTGSGLAIREGSIASFSATESYRVSLSLNTETLAISLTIKDSGGTSVVSTGWLASSVTGFTSGDLSSIVATGFRMQGVSLAGGSAIDNFELITTSSIPEPSSLAVIAGAGVLLMALFGNRRVRGC